MITADVIRPGAAVVSGGITWEGRRLRPDVDESCAEVAGWITPRLGGVGVTTVAMLLRNTVACAEGHARTAAATSSAPK
jgi:methylenetetrahydrofolate dehydrogenase (NADP+)/methenyltetrahydrofolate cyclohydrolase